MPPKARNLAAHPHCRTLLPLFPRFIEENGRGGGTTSPSGSHFQGKKVSGTVAEVLYFPLTSS
jgi:hypothetical protein